ncbi:hypothetical protein CG736_08870 [Kitasatospora sp. CB02891]|nr:hypothetical protein CG736_08870 [Kitasatospora sp. CB02891]
MSEPWTEPPTPGTPTDGAPVTTKSLLEQMQELLASINTDLAGLDSDLRDTAPASEPDDSARA